MDAKRKRSDQKTRLESEMQGRQVFYAILFVFAWTVFFGAAASLFTTTSTEDGDGALTRVGVSVALMALGAVFGVVSAYKFRAWGRDIEYYYKEVTQGVLVDAFEVDSESTLRYFFGRAKTIYRVQLKGRNRAGETVTYTRGVPETQWKVVYSRRKGQYFDLTSVPRG